MYLKPNYLNCLKKSLADDTVFSLTRFQIFPAEIKTPLSATVKPSCCLYFSYFYLTFVTSLNQPTSCEKIQRLPALCWSEYKFWKSVINKMK